MSSCTLVVSNSDPPPKRKGGSGHPGGLKRWSGYDTSAFAAVYTSSNECSSHPTKVPLPRLLNHYIPHFTLVSIATGELLY